MKKSKKTNIFINEKTFLNSRNYKKGRRIKKQQKIKSKLFYKYFLFIVAFLIIFFAITCLIYFLLPKNSKSINNIKTHQDFNNIIEPYIKAQKDFCENNNKYINEKYENEIFLSNVKINELKYQMYIFNSRNFILNEFRLYGAYEIPLSNNIIEALKFYASKYNITNNKDIFMLDIGSNVGWYPSLLGRYNYTILCFEAFKRNYYVSKKNYCYLNKDSNVIIITKGLGEKEKLCHYFNQVRNSGNGMVICDDNKNNLNNKNLGKMFKKNSEVEITTLDSFKPYLSNKNIVLMKIDVEGYEYEVLKGGKELITKYHVPFVALEFSPGYLKEVGSEPRELAQFFVDNGYKISLKGFLSKEFISVDELLNRAGIQVNCYFIHDSIL